MTEVAQSVSYQSHIVSATQGEKMKEAVPDPIAKAIADEMARAQAALDWAALVKACAAAGLE